jgi:hypothetical protein
VSGRATRAKGRRGETEAKHLLTDRDWSVADLTAGLATEDLIATDPDGKAWCVEVKNTVTISVVHKKQARMQAEKRRMPWMLLNKIAGTSCWLVQRQGCEPVVWRAKENPAS